MFASKKLVLHAVLLCLSTALTVLAQSDRGTITGIVSDSTGAVLPKASVSATNVSKGIVSNTVTNEEGNYTIALLPAGVYLVKVELAGFRTYIREGITIQVAQTVRLDITLQIGEISETVEVQGDASVLRTESAELSTSITTEKLSALPIDFSGAMRNPMSFLRLVPGSSVSRDQSWPVTSQNGLQSFSEEIRIDGASSTNPTPGVFNEAQPSVDAIQEINIQTSNFNAEYGQAGGAIMNMTLKSGTNQLHGTAYEYLRNEFFNAKNKDLPESDPKTKLRRHEFGGTVGGPLVIPRLYNGHNKTFWFTSYEQFYTRDNQKGYWSVPRDEWRQGDLSSLLLPTVLGTDVLGRPIRQGQIYDPATTRTVVVGGQSYVVRDPFPNNQVPLRSEVAKNILGFLPQAGISGLDANNLLGPTGTPLRDEVIWSLKMDHELSPKSHLSGSFNYMYTHKINGATPFGAADSARDQTITSKIVRINHDYTFGANAINHFAVGVLRYQNPDGVPDRGFDPEAQLGLKGVLITGWFPGVNFLDSSVSSFGTQQLKHLYHTVPTVVDSFSKVLGSHTIKFGGEYRKAMANFFGGNGAYGSLSFGSAQTALPYLSGSSGIYSLTGASFASFLLGEVGAAGLNSPVHMSYRYSDYAFYIQDDFKVTPRLTINYGLRYDLHRPLSEKWDRISSFVPDLPNPAAGGRPGALGFLGSGTEPGRTGRHSWLDTDFKDLGPRIGLAYRATDKTVLRGGFGIVYGRVEVNTFDPIQSVGSGSVTTAYPPINPAIQSQFNLDTGFPPVNALPPVFDPTLLNNQGIGVFRPESGRLPRIYSWNIAVQRQINQNLSVEAAYVGNHGTRLITGNFVNLNQNDLSILPMGDKLLQQINNAQDAAALGVPYPYPGFQGTVAQALRPYPQFQGIGDLQATVGESDYNSLQVKVQQRLSRGLDFLVSYTLSKNITTVDDAFGWAGAGSTDVKNLSLERGLAIAGTSSRAAKLVVGGWKVSGILQYASGGALGLGYPNNLGNTLFNNGGRYNVVPGQSRTNDVTNVWPGTGWLFNVNAFAPPAAYTIGNAARTYSDIRGFPYKNEDFALAKQFKISENKRLEIRCDLLNAFNRSIWNNPNTSVTEAPRIQGGRAIGFGSFWGRSNIERQLQLQARFTF
jgi:hypothetical protein